MTRPGSRHRGRCRGGRTRRTWGPAADRRRWSARREGRRAKGVLVARRPRRLPATHGPAPPHRRRRRRTRSGRRSRGGGARRDLPRRAGRRGRRPRRRRRRAGPHPRRRWRRGGRRSTRSSRPARGGAAPSRRRTGWRRAAPRCAGPTTVRDRRRAGPRRWSTREGWRGPWPGPRRVRRPYAGHPPAARPHRTPRRTVPDRVRRGSGCDPPCWPTARRGTAAGWPR